MRVAAGREFFHHFGAAAADVVPDIEWALFNQDGSWSGSHLDCDLLVYAADAYTPAFVNDVVQIEAPSWAHTEDAGLDGLFYDAMRERGAQLTHSPGANAVEVAEMAFGQVLWSAKRLGALRDQQRAHHWEKLALESLSDKTLLIAGLGAIGGRLASLGKAFGLRVLGVRRSPEAVSDVDEQGTLDDLPRMLPRADFVVLAMPLTPETEAMIDGQAMELMKPDATLVNVGRGALIDRGIEGRAALRSLQACRTGCPAGRTVAARG